MGTVARYFTETNAVKLLALAGESLDLWAPLYNVSSAPEDHPILNCRTCFDAFCYEYSVGRGIKGPDAEHPFPRISIQDVLRDAALHLDQGAELDRLAHVLHSTKLTHYHAVSLVSKVAHFLFPTSVIPLDRFSIAGLTRLGVATRSGLQTQQGPAVLSLKKYQAAWQPLLPEVERAASGLDHSGYKDQGILNHRMLDLFLMAAGGRFDENLLGIAQKRGKSARKLLSKAHLAGCKVAASYGPSRLP